MSAVAGSIWWLIVALGVLVTFHELGHYLLARRFGVFVQRFSVGYGKPFWSRYDRNGTEWAVAAIPLGGYVKMLDEREGAVPPARLDETFNQKPVGQRMAIVAAGPAFNLIFTLAAFWLMFMVGVPDIRALLGETTGVAEEAGLRSGDEVVAVDGESIQSRTHLALALLTPALDRKPVSIVAESGDGRQRELVLNLQTLPETLDEERVLEELGLHAWRPRAEPVIGEVIADSPAEEAGLQAGDRILSIDGVPVSEWNDLPALVDEHGSADLQLMLDIERGGTTIAVEVEPKRIAEDRLQMGVAPPPADAALQADADRYYTVAKYGPLAAVGASASETWRITRATLGLLGRMVTGDASLKNLSGPISIARYARDSAALGFSRFLFFLAVLSLSLAILNILPIPILDGGQMLYFLVEWIKGSPVSERTQVAGQYVGLLALSALVILTFYNDILRITSA